MRKLYQEHEHPSLQESNTTMSLAFMPLDIFLDVTADDIIGLIPT